MNKIRVYSTNGHHIPPWKDKILTSAGKRLHGKKMKGGKTKLMRIQKPLPDIAKSREVTCRVAPTYSRE